MWIRFALFNAALAAFVTALPRPALGTLAVSPVRGTLAVGAVHRVTARPTAVAAARVRVRFATLDTTVAVVDSMGRVTVRGAGTTQLIVTAHGEAPGFEPAERSVAVAIRAR